MKTRKVVKGTNETSGQASVTEAGGCHRLYSDPRVSSSKGKRLDWLNPLQKPSQGRAARQSSGGSPDPGLKAHLARHALLRLAAFPPGALPADTPTSLLASILGPILTLMAICNNF